MSPSTVSNAAASAQCSSSNLTTNRKTEMTNWLPEIFFIAAVISITIGAVAWKLAKARRKAREAKADSDRIEQLRADAAARRADLRSRVEQHYPERSKVVTLPITAEFGGEQYTRRRERTPAPSTAYAPTPSPAPAPDYLAPSMVWHTPAPAPIEPEPSCRASSYESGRSGDFAGGGASGSWDNSTSSASDGGSSSTPSD